MIKIVFSDLDGTLANHAVIPEKTVEIVKKLNRKIKFNIITGKHGDFYEQLVLKNLVSFIMLENGCVIIKNLGQKFVKDLDWDNIMLPGFEKSKIVAERLSEKNKIHWKTRSFTIDLNSNSPEIKEEYLGLVNVDKNGNWLDISPKPGGKGNATKYLCKKLNISLKDAAALGNDFNDIGMLNVVGLPCAVADAPEEVKRIVRRKKGIISTRPGAEGGFEILEKIFYNHV